MVPTAAANYLESTLSLLVLRVFANDSDAAFSLNNFAFFANRLNGRSNFHENTLLSKSLPLSISLFF